MSKEVHRWYYWDGKRYLFYVECPCEMSARDLLYTLRSLKLITRQLFRRLREVRTKDNEVLQVDHAEQEAGGV